MASVAVLAFVVSITLHLGVTALLALRFGQTPPLVSSTGIAVEWTRLRDGQAIAVGAGGSVVSALLATAGWLVVRRSRGRPGRAALLGWFTFAFNAWLLAAWTVTSPLLGVGGWMAIVDRFANRGPMRASVVAAGLFLLALTWKESPPSLAWLAGNGSAEVRTLRARRLVRTAWATVGIATFAAAAWTPISVGRSVAVVAGVLLATAPMLAAANRVGEHPVRGLPLSVPRSAALIMLGAGLAGAFVLLLGRGVVPG